MMKRSPTLTTTALRSTTRPSSRRFNSTRPAPSSSSSSPPPRLPPHARRYLPYALGAGALLAGLGYAASSGPDDTPSPSLAKESTLTLLRSYLVWTLTSFPSIVDASPKLLDTVFHSRIPLVKPTGEFIVRHTFFPQFIPGETADECLPKMEEMRRRNVGHALNYSAEADTVDEDVTKKRDPVLLRLQEVEKAIDVQGAFERRMAEEGWAKGSSAFALKTTGLIDPQVLVRASNAMHRLHAAKTRNSPAEVLANEVNFPGCPQTASAVVLNPSEVPYVPGGAVKRMRVFDDDVGLQQGDLAQLKLLWDRLESLAERSRRNGVRLIIDAEEAVYQPALDGYTMLLSAQFNRPPPGGKAAAGSPPWTGPVVYGTYQSYLTRQPSYLKACLAHAAENGYALGLKVVRGGYIVQERRTARIPGREGEDPIWPTKPETDASYNGSVATIISTLGAQLSSPKPEQALSVIFGTHNRESVDTVIDQLEKTGLAKKGESGKLKLRDDVAGRVGIAQLYGMREDLSDVVTQSFEPSKLPMSLKFVAYGRLLEVMPFLGRRAVENKSIMSGPSGAAAERRRVGAELRRRFFG